MQKKELAIFEQKIIDFIPDKYRNIIIKQRGFIKQVDKFEDFISPFLLENGFIDGVALNDFLSAKQPTLLNFISFPNEPFRLVELFNEIYKFLFGGGL